jgi:hypothetical protein
MPNEAYQQERVAEHFSQNWILANRAVSQALGEKGALIARLFDLLLFQYFYQRPDLSDSEVKVGLERLKRHLSPLHLPPAGHPPLGEYLLKEWETFQKEKEAFSKELAVEVIERYLHFISGFSGGEARSVRFIRGLVGFINQRNPDWAAEVREKQKRESPIISVTGLGARSFSEPV